MSSIILDVSQHKTELEETQKSVQAQKTLKARLGNHVNN